MLVPKPSPGTRVGAGQHYIRLAHQAGVPKPPSGAEKAGRRRVAVVVVGARRARCAISCSCAGQSVGHVAGRAGHARGGRAGRGRVVVVLAGFARLAEIGSVMIRPKNGVANLVPRRACLALGL